LPLTILQLCDLDLSLTLKLVCELHRIRGIFWSVFKLSVSSCGTGTGQTGRQTDRMQHV